MDVTAPHVVTIPDLIVPRLTVEQAQIIQDYTKFDLGIPSDEMLYSTRVDMPLAAKEAFDLLRPCQSEMASRPFLDAKILHVILEQMTENPFSCWDSRIDVILRGHISHKTQAHIRVYLSQINATVEFNKRPGSTEQTWIVINRPDPSAQTMDEAVRDFRQFWEDHGNDTLVLNDKHQSQLRTEMNEALPARHEAEFIRRAWEITGSQSQVTITIHRERFKNHAPIVVVTRQFPVDEFELNNIGCPRGLPYDEKGWQPN